jgi:aspartate racemase
MKHIGIVGITTVGACICANEVVAEANRKKLVHPEYTLHVLPFDQYKNKIINQEWNAVAELILASIQKLKKIGADFIIIPANTVHYGFSVIEANSPLPVLNIIEISVNECVRGNFKNVGVLGTKQTMLGGLYDEKLRSQGIKPIIPSSQVCDRIQSLIFDEILSSKINQQTVATVAQDIKNLACDAVILGCTELPEVYNEDNLGLSAIDTTRLLAHKALDYALS